MSDVFTNGGRAIYLGGSAGAFKNGQSIRLGNSSGGDVVIGGGYPGGNIRFEIDGTDRVWLDGSGTLRYNGAEVANQHDLRTLLDADRVNSFAFALFGVIMAFWLRAFWADMQHRRYLARQPKDDQTPYRSSTNSTGPGVLR